MTREIQVDADWLPSGIPIAIGSLLIDFVRGKETYAFSYDQTWLNTDHARNLDPDLQLFAGRQALTDGVFAIVMTLMVFNLSLPKDRPITNLQQELLDLWPSFVAYAISFGMAGIYWSANHNMFRFIRRSSHELVWLTIMFLAFISLLPFSTGLLARFHNDVTALVFYGGNLELIGLSLFWIWFHSTRSRRLTDPNLPDAVIRFGQSRILAGIVGYGIATGLAFWSTTAALAVFLLIPMLFILSPVQRFWVSKYGLHPTHGGPVSGATPGNEGDP